MSDYRITTHWSTPKTNPLLSRHVYVKENRVQLPQPGDVVFIREALDARDKSGRLVRLVDRHHQKRVTSGLQVPKGTGGIIGSAIVDGPRREQIPDDVLFDFGDLREWLVVPCKDFRPAQLSLNKLCIVLKKDNVRGLNLWRMPESLGAELMKLLCD